MASECPGERNATEVAHDDYRKLCSRRTFSLEVGKGVGFAFPSGSAYPTQKLRDSKQRKEIRNFKKRLQEYTVNKL